MTAGVISRESRVLARIKYANARKREMAPDIEEEKKLQGHFLGYVLAFRLVECKPVMIAVTCSREIFKPSGRDFPIPRGPSADCS